MASLALGLLGGYLFGPVGYLVGSFLGNLLDPIKQQGPRLTDLHLQQSKYGEMLPMIWGTVRIAGNVIWQTDLVEHSSTSGGKGGPQVTTFTYSASFAIALCAGPILGVKRVWADGRIIYGADTSNETNIPMTLYLGDRMQTADPTMQSTLGATNVPGFRDTAYVVFANLDLSQFYNRIPNLEFEVFTAQGTIPIRISTWDAGRDAYADAPVGVTYNASTQVITIANYLAGTGGYNISEYQFPTGAQIGTTSSAPTLGSVFGRVANWDLSAQNVPSIGQTWVQNNALGNAFTTGNGITSGAVGYVIVDSAGNGNVFFPSSAPSVGVTAWPMVKGAAQGTPVASFAIGGNVGDIALGVTSGGNLLAWLDEPGGLMYELTPSLTVVNSWTPAQVPSFGGGFYKGVFYMYGNILAWGIFQPSPISERLGLLQLTGSTLSIYQPQLRDGGGGIPSFVWTGNTAVQLTGGYVLDADGIILLDPPTAGVPLSKIVSDVSVACQLTTAQIDVTQLTDIVDGFVISQQTDGRNILQSLRNAYFFDAVESTGIIKFPKRLSLPVATIPLADLAAFEGGSGTPPPPVQSDRTQELDLPMRVNVQYLNVGADYQKGSQYSQRQVTHSQNVTSLDLPIVLSDLAAKMIADANLTAAWVEREKYTFYTSRQYAYLEPTDVIVANGREMRIITREETSTKTIKFEALASLAQVYQVASVAALPGFTPQPVPLPVAATDLLLLDTPLVVDSDAPLVQGYYAALAPAGSGPWAAAGLFQSIDGGVSYNEVLATRQVDTIGVAVGTLGAFDPRNNIFDEINMIVVNVQAGLEPSGASYGAVLNGANLCVIGSELLQFRNAVLIALGQYQLSGLLRGRRGTEWAIATHAANEPFALLPVNRAVMDLSQFFLNLDYKGITAGQPITSGGMEAFTNTGAAFKPLAPVQLGGGSDASGNVTLNWVYRTRIGGSWMPYVDVPLSEPGYLFAVQIWNAAYSQCARILYAGRAEQDGLYTAASQIIDFGALQQQVFFTVNQYGQLGPGYRGTGVAAGIGSSNTSPLSPVTPLAGT